MFPMPTTPPSIRNEIMIRPTDYKNLGELRAAKQLMRQQLIERSKTVYKEVLFGTVPALKSNVKTQAKAQKMLTYGFLAWRSYKIGRNVLRFFSLFSNHKKKPKKNPKKLK